MLRAQWQPRVSPSNQALPVHAVALQFTALPRKFRLWPAHLRAWHNKHLSTQCDRFQARRSARANACLQ